MGINDDVRAAVGAWLTGDECKALVLAAIGFNGAATQDEIRRVVDWAEGVRIDAAALELILDGRMYIKHDGVEATFRLVDDELARALPGVPKEEP